MAREPGRSYDHEAAGRTNAAFALVGDVIQADTVHDGLHVHQAAPRPAPVVPRQLHAVPELFAGRAAELAELDRALTTAAGGGRGPGATVVISAIGGTGGIGKTWLALAWAHRHLDRFPDGQLFVDLRGFSPAGPQTAPADALRGFLDALGVDPNRIPHDADAQAALYRSLVADKRMLIVLDNAATAEQVVPLLPGTASCTVLVTSRNRLPGLVTRHGARPLSLGFLTDAEARALLIAALGADHVAADGHAVAELIARCGGFPLALGLIAARVRTQPHLPLDEAVAELRELGLDALDSGDPTASLPTVLSWSLRHLTDEHRRVFALLGIAPGPDTGLPAAASLTGLSAAGTRTALRVLGDAYLVERNPGGRYAMHDLVRAYAAALAEDLPGPARAAALERVVDFFLHTAHAAHILVNPHTRPIGLDHAPASGSHHHPLPDHPAAMAWLDAEHPHLIAAQDIARAHRRHHAVWHLAWTLTAFHQRRGHLHDDLAVWCAALDAATHLPDPIAGARAHRYLGRAHGRLGRREEALRHLHRALALAEHHRDPNQQAGIHHDLVLEWGRRGDDRKALGHARRALDLNRSLDNPVGEADALNALGWCAARLGDHDTAREHCEAALVLHRQHHNLDGEAATLDSLGYVDHHTGHHGQAIDRYRQALALHRALGNTYEVADILDHLGHPHAAVGEHDQARAVWSEALQLYREQVRESDAERVSRQLDDLTATGPAG